MSPTVPILSIVCMAVSGLVSLLLPIALLLFVRQRYKARLAPCFVGAAAFILFALVLNPLFKNLVALQPAISGFISANWWALGLFGGLTAGLFEETGRLLSFFLLRRRYNNLGGALAYGIGHGGIEAIIFCTLGMTNNIIYSVILNASGAEALQLLIPGTEGAVAALAEPLSWLFLIGGVERIIAISFHIAASVLVWLAATGRGPWGLYFLAILFHTMVNFPIGLVQGGIVTNQWAIEGIMAAVVLLVCFVTSQIYWKCNQFYTPLLQYAPGKLHRR